MATLVVFCIDKSIPTFNTWINGYTRIGRNVSRETIHLTDNHGKIAGIKRLINLGEFDAATIQLNQIITESGRNSNPPLAAKTYDCLAWISFVRGRYGDSIAFTDRMVECSPDDATTLLARGNMGRIYLRLGEFDKSIECFKRAIGIAKNLDKKSGILRNLPSLAYAVGLSGSPFRAMGILDGIEPPPDGQSNLTRDLVIYYEYRGHLCFLAALAAESATADIPEGLDALKVADSKLSSGDGTGEKNYRDWELSQNSGLYQLGMIATAISGLEEGLKIAERIAPKGDLIGQIHRILAEIHLHNGNLEVAQEHAHKGLEVARRIGEQYEVGILSYVFGQIALLENEPDQARLHFGESKNILTNIGARYELRRLFGMKGVVL